MEEDDVGGAADAPASSAPSTNTGNTDVNKFGSSDYDEAGGNPEQGFATINGQPQSDSGPPKFNANQYKFPSETANHFGMTSQSGTGYQTNASDPNWGQNPYAQSQGSLDRSNAAGQQYAASMNATNAPIAYKQGVFNKVFPLAQSLLNGGAGGGFSVAAAGGQNTPQLALPSSSVYTPQQIQGQINQAQAVGNQGAASQKQQIANQMAGRGFGATSPVALALQQGADIGARAQNAQQSQSIGFNAATANAQQSDTVSQLGNQQWQNWNNADIQRRQNQANYALGTTRNAASLIQALGSL